MDIHVNKYMLTTTSKKETVSPFFIHQFIPPHDSPFFQFLPNLNNENVLSLNP